MTGFFQRTGLYTEYMERRLSRGKPRPYRLQRRAQQVDETRQRITEAAMRPHTSVGPSEASLSAIAAEAGVTRVTLYRHFSSPDELFRACMEHWTATDPPPNPGPWLVIGDFPTRVRQALSDIAPGTTSMAATCIRSIATKFAPASNLAAARAISERIADALLSGMATPKRDVKLLRATLVHVVGFWTWRLLTAETGLSSSEAAELGVALRPGRGTKRTDVALPVSAYHSQSRSARRLEDDHGGLLLAPRGPALHVLAVVVPPSRPEPRDALRPWPVGRGWFGTRRPSGRPLHRAWPGG